MSANKFLRPEFLMARRVKNLRCEENRQDDYETTMHSLELGRKSDAHNQIRPEQVRQYTWSVRSEAEAAGSQYC
jgi:hypothetical protein